jgi:anti-sigma-K factor RskA
MATESIHDLSAAYALDALDASELEEFEAHLASCESCRDEVATLSAAATSLAYATEAATPPPRLRARILEEIAAPEPAELPANVIPLRRRRPVQLLGAVAAVAACAAIGLGTWAGLEHGSLSTERSARGQDLAALAVLADPHAQRIPLKGADGQLVVTQAQEAAIVMRALPAAPSGKTYEAWVIRGGTAVPAGLFHGGMTAVLRLQRPVPHGSTVGVTIERAGGASQPTSAPIITALT